jgi:hypothetical protein
VCDTSGSRCGTVVARHCRLDFWHNDRQLGFLHMTPARHFRSVFWTLIFGRQLDQSSSRIFVYSNDTGLNYNDLVLCESLEVLGQVRD